ncbi:MAG: diaminopimelate epimerase [Alistipes sp.]|nr:diaminopimelate epimerase [Alistipes sp.]
MLLTFCKYEGAGNDFILADNRAGEFRPDARTIARLCDRHRGIGADGLMTLSASPQHDCSMRYYNADGSPGEMCGNGARCFALYAEHLGIGGREKIFDATDGVHRATILSTAGAAGEIEVGMIDVERIVCGEGWWFLNTGVPHYVEFVDDPAAVDVTGRGARIRHDTARFPQGTNVNFVQLVGEGHLRMRTYERGVENETLACGTGATAAAIVANFVRQPTADRFRIDLPGGRLQVAFTRRSDRRYTDIRLTGPARRVFEGTIDYSDNER